MKTGHVKNMWKNVNKRQNDFTTQIYSRFKHVQGNYDFPCV